MKRFCVVLMVVTFVFVGQRVNAQRMEASVQVDMIEPVAIEATFDQTTNLIFPFAIKNVDWGSSGIIVQQRKGVKNILHVKAATVNFAPTSLSVVTSDGAFYSFLVQYVVGAESLSYQITKEYATAIADLPVNDESMQSAARRVRAARPFLYVATHTLRANLALKGVYLEHEALWLTFSLRNRSLIDFPVDYIRFFIKDKKTGKRTVIQEKELIPVYSEGAGVVSGRQAKEMLFAFETFTVPKGKRLEVQMGEKNNGRFLQLRIKGKRILQAKTIMQVSDGN